MFDQILKIIEKEINGVTYIFEKHSLLGNVCKVKDLQLDINHVDFDTELDDFCKYTWPLFKIYTLSPAYMPKMDKETIDKLSDFDSLLSILNKYRG